MHHRVQFALPPLIERCCASRRRRRSKNSVQKRGVINWILRAEIKTHRCREQNQQRQPRFHQLDQIANESRPSVSNFGLSRFDCRRFHRFLVFKICEQIAHALTPNDNMIAPTATCAVAISAALLLQIVHAPRVNCKENKTIHRSDNRRSAVSWLASLATRTQKTITAIPIKTARNRGV